VVWGACTYNCEIHVQAKLKFNIQHAPVTKEASYLSTPSKIQILKQSRNIIEIAQI